MLPPLQQLLHHLGYKLKINNIIIWNEDVSSVNARPFSLPSVRTPESILALFLPPSVLCAFALTTLFRFSLPGHSDPPSFDPSVWSSSHSPILPSSFLYLQCMESYVLVALPEISQKHSFLKPMEARRRREEEAPVAPRRREAEEGQDG